MGDGGVAHPRRRAPTPPQRVVGNPLLQLDVLVVLWAPSQRTDRSEPVPENTPAATERMCAAATGPDGTRYTLGIPRCYL